MKSCGIIGIDPGRTGALCYVRYEHDALSSVLCFAVPVDESTGGIQVSQVHRWLTLIPSANLVAIESVRSFPGESNQSSFVFGQSFGSLLALAELYCRRNRESVIPLHLIRPQSWKRTILGPGRHEKADSVTFFRQQMKSSLETVAPKTNDPTGNHNIADAFCIAHYAFLCFAKGK